MKERVEEIQRLWAGIRKEGVWQSIWQHNKPQYIRDKAGCLVKFYHPIKYSGQEERFQRERAEVAALSELIKIVPEMAEIIKELYAENQALKADKEKQVAILQKIESKTLEAIDLGDRNPVVEYCYLRSSEYNIPYFINKTQAEAALQSKGE